MIDHWKVSRFEPQPGDDPPDFSIHAPQVNAQSLNCMHSADITWGAKPDSESRAGKPGNHGVEPRPRPQVYQKVQALTANDSRRFRVDDTREDESRNPLQAKGEP